METCFQRDFAQADSLVGFDLGHRRLHSLVVTQVELAVIQPAKTVESWAGSIVSERQDLAVKKLELVLSLLPVCGMPQDWQAHLFDVVISLPLQACFVLLAELAVWVQYHVAAEVVVVAVAVDEVKTEWCLPKTKKFGFEHVKSYSTLRCCCFGY